MEMKGSVLIVAHDAGGAEILAHYVKQQRVDCQFVIGGPAQKIFQRVLGEISCCSIQEGLAKTDWCLCGTSWQSDLEFLAIKQAKALGKRVVSFIDHWVNYQQRFMRDGERQLPDEIWVGDRYAKAIARQAFPCIPVRQLENPYFKSVRQEIRLLGKQISRPSKAATTLLFVSENLSGHAQLKYGDSHYFGYTEFDALAFLLKYLDCVSKDIETLVIRPHPSDSAGKYQQFIERNKGKVILSENVSLLEDICQVDWVAGCESMALVIALLAEKNVFNCIPLHRQCRLPYPEIVSLWEQVQKKHPGAKKD